jgi:hypothetical protein
MFNWSVAGYKRQVVKGLLKVRDGFRDFVWRQEEMDSAFDDVIYQNEGSVPLKDGVGQFDDYRAVASFEDYQAGYKYSSFMKHSEYLIKCHGNVCIEPRTGWAIVSPGRLLSYSIPYSYCTPLPAVADCFPLGLRRRRVVKEKCVISLHDLGGGNYFHCFNDILAKLVLLEKHGVDKGIPLVISPKYFDKPFFQAILDRSDFGNRTWVVQRDFYIQSKQAYFCKARPFCLEYIQRLLAIIGVPRPATENARRIFLTRSGNTGRYVSNLREVEAVVSKFDFEIIDAASISFSEQVKIFSECRYLIGVHGAGMVNMIFRQGSPLSVLELFPSNNIPPHYYWTAMSWNYDYDLIVGDTHESGRGIFESLPFKVPLKKLHSKIEQMLDRTR